MSARFRLLALGLLLLASLGLSRAMADPVTVRVARPIDIVALPLLVMQREHLIERTAEAMGIADISVTWSTPADSANGAVNALAAGQVDLALVDLVPFLVAADGGAGNAAADIRAVAAVVGRPYVLLARKQTIGTIRDFGPGDRIAVPALNVSGPAVMLEMAASQEWGIEHYNKLDPLVVAQPDAAAADALISGKGDIDAHFSRTPYADSELGEPGVHRVMDSFDIAGPHTAAVLATTMRFRTGNPELCKAILSALQAADDYIKNSPGKAAEIFAAAAKEQEIPLEDVSDMIGDPDLAYRAAPAGLTHLIEFLYRIHRLQHRPAAWQVWFLPESRDLAGN